MHAQHRQHAQYPDQQIPLRHPHQRIHHARRRLIQALKGRQTPDAGINPARTPPHIAHPIHPPAPPPPPASPPAHSPAAAAANTHPHRPQPLETVRQILQSPPDNSCERPCCTQVCAPPPNPTTTRASAPRGNAPRIPLSARRSPALCSALPPPRVPRSACSENSPPNTATTPGPDTRRRRYTPQSPRWPPSIPCCARCSILGSPCGSAGTHTPRRCPPSRPSTRHPPRSLRNSDTPNASIPPDSPGSFAPRYTCTPPRSPAARAPPSKRAPPETPSSPLPAPASDAVAGPPTQTSNPPPPPLPDTIHRSRHTQTTRHLRPQIPSSPANPTPAPAPAPHSDNCPNPSPPSPRAGPLPGCAAGPHTH